MCGWCVASSSNPSGTLSRIREFQARACSSVSSSGLTRMSMAVRSLMCVSREDGGPVVLHAHQRPAELRGHPERRLGTPRVGELAVVVVVAHQEREPRALEHLDVHVT